MPLDSHDPRFPNTGVVPPSTSVGPSSAPWLTFATAVFTPVARSNFQSRAVVAAGSVVGSVNCWLEPGSSVMSRLFFVDSMLSGWCISFSVLYRLVDRPR